MSKIIATYSPCCNIFHLGDAEQGVMHCALPHDRKVVRLVDAEELGRFVKVLHQIAYEPIGEADASDSKVLDDIVEMAREALAGRRMPEITKPCPFCGTPPRVEDGEHESNMKFEYFMGSKERPHYVQCIMCGASGPLSATEQEAADEWNNAECWSE